LIILTAVQGKVVKTTLGSPPISIKSAHIGTAKRLIACNDGCHKFIAEDKVPHDSISLLSLGELTRLLRADLEGLHGSQTDIQGTDKGKEQQD
jgi:hypothetical protein